MPVYLVKASKNELGLAFFLREGCGEERTQVCGKGPTRPGVPAAFQVSEYLKHGRRRMEKINDSGGPKTLS